MIQRTLRWTLTGIVILCCAAISLPASASTTMLQVEIKKIPCDLEALQAQRPHEQLVIPDYCENTPDTPTEELPTTPDTASPPIFLPFQPTSELPTSPVTSLPNVMVPEPPRLLVDHTQATEQLSALSLILTLFAVIIVGITIIIDCLYFNWRLTRRILGFLQRLF